MSISAVKKVQKVSSVTKVPSIPSGERRVALLDVGDKPDPVEEYIKGTDPRQTTPERIVEKYLITQDWKYFTQKRVYRAESAFTGYGRMTVDFMVFGIPGRSPAIIRVMGEYYHMRPVAAARDDRQLRVLLGLGYHVVTVWANDLVEAVRDGSINSFMERAIYDVSPW